MNIISAFEPVVRFPSGVCNGDDLDIPAEHTINDKEREPTEQNASGVPDVRRRGFRSHWNRGREGRQTSPANSRNWVRFPARVSLSSRSTRRLPAGALAQPGRLDHRENMHVYELCPTLALRARRESDDRYLPFFIPVTGSRKSLFSPPTGPAGAKRNMFSIDPAFSSNEKLPIRPVSQLSSMKRSTDV
jgi:hypothetical protein